MTAESWQKLKEWFDQAIELEGEARQQFLESINRQEPILGEELCKLVANHPAAENYFSASTAALKFRPVGESLPGLQEGQVLYDRFVVKKLVGSGGMGDVYEAFDQVLGVTVALKTVRGSFEADEQLLLRLPREVQVARVITHANVCRVHDLFYHRSSEGVLSGTEMPIISMEFLRGETLLERLRRQGPLPSEAAERIIRQIGEGLAAAHRAGVVHRDLKPGNVMLVPATGGDRAVITDFGLARYDVSRQESRPSITALAGTPGYMAPEQLEGESATLRSDIYALGVIAFQMMTGKLPHGDQVPDSIPERWHRFLGLCLQTDPGLRFPSASEALAELPAGQENVARRAPPRRQWRRLALLLTLPVALSLSLLFLRLYSEMPRLPKGARVLLTNIRTSEPGLSGVTVALRSQLSQSARFELMKEAQVSARLKQMGKSPSGDLDATTAREVALRDGATLVIYGSVAVLGQEYLLALRMEQVGGTPLFARRTWTKEFPAPSQNALFDAVHAGASWIRTTSGEASRDLAEQDQHPEDTTTNSWQALQLYEKARRASEGGDDESAALVLGEAVRLDPNFAMAFAKLGDVLLRLKRYKDGYTAWKQAFQLVGKKQFTSREQLRISGQYYEETGDYLAAERTYRTYLVHYPDDQEASFYLASVLDDMGRQEEAITRFQDVWGRWPEDFAAGVHAGWIEIRQQRFQEAGTVASKLRTSGETDWATWLDALGQFAQGQTSRALVLLDPLRLSGSSYWRSRSYLVRGCWLSELDLPSDAMTELQHGITYDLSQGLREAAATKHVLLAQLDLQLKNSAAARDECWSARALDASPQQAARIGRVLALAGFPDEARSLRDELTAYDDIPLLRAMRHEVNAAIETATHSPRRALDELRMTAAIAPSREWRHAMARAWAAVGDRPRALASYKEIVDNPALFWPGPQTEEPDLLLQSRLEYEQLKNGTERVH